MAGLRFLKPRFDTSPSVRLYHGAVHLRPPIEGDWPAWAALRERSREFLVPWEPTWANDALSQASFRRRCRQYAADWHEGVGYSFLLFHREDDRLLGGISLSNVRRGIVLTCSAGYWIGAPYARKGHMTDGVRAMLRFAFGQLGLHRVEAACIPDNEASRRLLLKVGFEQEGYAREYLKIDGKWRDHLLFGILADRANAEHRPSQL